MIGAVVTVGALSLRLLRHPSYADAHPGERCAADEVCEMCAIGARLDTGDEVLLWQCDGINWAVSRHDRSYVRHRTDSGA